MNSNDVDDLFKRAAEQYPLRTDNSDWDKVARALDEDDTSFAPVADFRDGKTKRRRLLWLLLLLPLIGIGIYYNIHNQSVEAVAKTSRPTSAGQKNNVATSIVDDEINKNSKEASTSKPVIKTDKHENSLQGKTGEKESRKESSAIGPIAQLKASSNLQSANRPKQRAAVKIYSGNESGNSSNDRIDNQSNKFRPSNAMLNMMPGENKSFGLSLQSIDHSFQINAADRLDRVNNFLMPVSPDSNADGKKPTTAKKNKPRSFFYAGLIVAPDISTVKFQSLKGAGYTAGILLGYSLNAKWELETGIYLDSKKYYTEGAYFSKEKVPLLNYGGVDLKNVNGFCRMIELPVNLRYNIHSGKKDKWFATTGLSTYLVFKEFYTYDYLYNGMDMKKSYDYHSSSQNWFSIINLSAGYERHIGKIGELRVEPYLRMPLSGMGTGSLPIMSAGLNVGITHRIN